MATERNEDYLEALDTIIERKGYAWVKEDSKRITEGIYTTGRLKDPVDEQSLILKSRKGWYVLVGCSHPGVDKILRVARQIGNIAGTIGGFHGFDNFSVVNDLDFICPCQCTKYKKELIKRFPEKSCECGVGQTIDLSM